MLINYLHKFHLVEAEKARVLGQFLEAEELYEQAIAGAAEHEFIQEEALAYELAAKHYLARGREKIAQTYMKEAHSCYERWGATAKVKELQTCYPQFFAQKAASTSTHPTAGNAPDRSAIATLAQQVAERTAGLQKSEANYHNLLQTANSIIVRYDPQGRIHYMNDYGLRFLGYEEHELLGRTLLETIVPETEISGRDRKQFIQDLLRNPASYQHDEGENLCGDGRRVWVAWSNQAILDEQGQVVEILSVGNDITQCKQAEDALQRSEAKFRTFFENSQVGIFRTRLSDGLLLDANQRHANLFGFDSPEEIIGLEYVTGYYADPSDHQHLIELLKRDREVRSFEVQMRKRDGTLFWGLFSLYLNAGDDYTEGVIADISDRKQAEVALQMSEERLRLALTASNQGLYDLNIKTEEVVVTPEYALMLGYDPATYHVTKSEWIESLHPDDRESVVAAYNACITGEVPNYQVEYRRRTQDGQWKWILSVGKIVAWNESGEPIRVLGVCIDIDDRKQAEAALQTSEERLRLALTASNQGLYDLNIETEEVVVNPEYALMLGYDPATFRLTKSTWIESLHPDDRESMVAIDNGFITGEVPNYRAEYRLRTQDGQWKWILSVGKIVAWNESGEPIRVLGVCIDIDDRKQAEAALQASEAELRALVSAIPDPLCIFNAEGQLICTVKGNPSYGEECTGKTLHQIFAKEQADEFLDYIQQVLRTQQVVTVEYSEWIAGREIWFSARIAPVRHEQVIWLARDITLQKQAEAASIIEERNRMAREIHDTLAQAFTGILAQVGAANQVLTDDVEATQPHLDLIKELARTGLTEARRSVVALRPQLLEEGSLQSALHRLVAQLRTAAMDTTLYYEVEGAVYSLPTEVESNLLRIGQEALTNATRHANADEIRVELVYDRDRFCLRVKDNGQGFGVGCISCSKGFGLLGMSERAERIGAQLTIKSQPGQGTEIIVTVDREASR
jgi:PAS domain S-box-containing protein